MTYLKNYKNWLFESSKDQLQVLDRLSKSGKWQDRILAAESLDSTEEIFNRLSRDKLSEIRMAVANNPNASPSALRYLYNHEDDDLEIRSSWRITRAAIVNPNMPVDVLRDIVKSNLDMKVLTSNTSPYLEWALANPNMPSDLLDEVAQHGPGASKKAVARHPNASEDALWLLSDNEATLIRIAVAKNPNTPAKILSRLAEDTNFVVKAEVTGNPNVSIESLVALKRDGNEEVRERAFNQLQYRVAQDRSIERKIEELETLMDLGVSVDVDDLNLDELDI